MCGIAGIFTSLPGNDVAWEGLLKNMTATLSHRGPDAEGYFTKYYDGCFVGLGHRRLSIIDVSAKANQPLCNEDGTV